MDIYLYENYKQFTIDSLVEYSSKIKGIRSRLAEFLNCQSAYISQILNKDAHFSIEQGHKVATFLSLSNAETDFYLALLQYERAGTTQLKSYYEKQIQKLKQESQTLDKRFKNSKAIEREHQFQYYSNWHYLCVHAYLSLNKNQRIEEISKRFNIPLNLVQEVISFLIKSGLVIKEDNHYKLTAKKFHLGNHSPMIARHHSNWRQRAMESFDRETAEDLHYSSVVTISKQDLPKCRSILVEAIEKIRNVVKDTTDEQDVFCYTADLFSL